MSKLPFYLNRIRSAACRDGLLAAARETKRIGNRLTGSLYYGFVLDDPRVIWGDWDVCVVLDGCRPDVLGEVEAEYDFLPHHIPTVTSVGSTSEEWLDVTFDVEYRGYLGKTGYVTGNPWTDSHGLLDELALLDEVWRYAWDEERGTQPPRPLTDRAIAAWRTRNLQQMVVHYMQPHFPSIPDPLDSGMELKTFGDEWPNRVWDRLEANDITSERVWGAYRTNCRHVLEEVRLLLHNLDAPKVVITSDHGNAFGEWGYYGHPGAVPIPALRTVPWVETSATDKRTHAPDDYDTDEQSNEAVSDRLSALGYRRE